MKRAVIGIVSTVALAASSVAPGAVAAESATAAPVVRSAETPDVLAAKKTKKAKKVTVKAGRSSVHVNGTVKLNGKVKPKGKRHVAFEQKFPKKNKWRGMGAKVTNKSGKAGLRAQLTVKGTYKFRLATKGKNSNVVKVKATGTNPPVPPVPPNPPTSVAVDWPSGDPLEVDRQYDVPVQVNRDAKVQVSLQHRTDGGDWADVYGGIDNTDPKDGSARLIMSIPDTGPDTFRVFVNLAGKSNDFTSDTVTRTFEDGGDTLYNVPMNLPNDTGKMVKAQEFPLDYPKLPTLKNPLDGNPLVIPSNIGGPNYPAGPPKCTVDGLLGEDCGIPGKQYRIMYTTERWIPNNTGGGSVQGGTQGATGLLLLPGESHGDVSGFDPDKVFVWAHPTLGQENKCSISRGVEDITSVNGATGAVTEGPGGMNINLTDMLFFLDHMLRDGWTVVMPDYLGIAVNGPTANQKTYLVGPQEARDIFYAADALQTSAKTGKGWPGMPERPTQKFAVAGHSQGGHAALWAGIKADDMQQKTGQKLTGVSAVAPATDLNMLVNTQWDHQANWIIGPGVIQTWAGYMGGWAFDNITITPEAVNNLTRYEGYCTTQAYAASYEFFPDGLQSQGVPFMLDPNDPKYARAFGNWAPIFGAQTPAAKSNDFNSDNLYPKDLPLQLISGTADQVVLSQITAAFQENFCSALDSMEVYWTPVTTGALNTNPPTTDALQAADHLNPLTFPWTNKVGTSGGKDQFEISGGSLMRFVSDPANANKNCGSYQTTHPAKNIYGNLKINSWYIVPQFLNSANAPEFYQAWSSPLLPPPAPAAAGFGAPSANPVPAAGTVTKNGLNIDQTGCGLPYKGTSNDGNPDCYQWGLYPYGAPQGTKDPWEPFLYADAGAGLGSKTWGGKNGKGYPFIPPKP